MKKMIILVGLFMSMASFAGEIVKTPMLDFVPTKDMDYMYEIKTAKFDNVILDCQSMFNGIRFSNKGEMVSNIYLSNGMCGELYDFMSESKRDGLPVCIGLDSEYQELSITRDTDECT